MLNLTNREIRRDREQEREDSYRRGFDHGVISTLRYQKQGCSLADLWVWLKQVGKWRSARAHESHKGHSLDWPLPPVPTGRIPAWECGSLDRSLEAWTQTAIGRQVRGGAA